jgi:plastocyanin
MARAITSPELVLLRGDTQFTKLYLAVFQPNTIYTARLNGVPASNDRVYQVTYDGGSGTLANVKANMTMYVGTVAGAYDLGMCRIRKTPGATTFYIGLTSSIAWADNAYLTIVDDFELDAKHATIASAVLSMDVDVAYSDQHLDFSPVPVLGTHAVAWLDAATVDVAFDASDSWVIDSSISTYAWTAPGCASIADDTTTTPTITYDTPGCYSVYCTVTAANGKSTLGVRHVFVYDRTDNPPTTVFQLSQCIGDNQTGGWMFDMSMQAEASLSEIRDRALVVLFAEDWYGTTNQSIGPVLNRENIICVGRIVGESLRWDTERSISPFKVFSIGSARSKPSPLK